MARLIKNGRVFLDGRLTAADLLDTSSGVFVFDKNAANIPVTISNSSQIDKVTDKSTADMLASELSRPDIEIIDATGKIIVPGFADVHVHFREPGFSYKETIKTGTLAAAAGGFTCVLPMPNLDPAPSDLESLTVELDIIKRDACIKTIPYGTITKEQDGRSELSDMESMAPYVSAFSDDGKGVQTGDLMRDAMELASSLGKLIVAHCEDESLVEPGGAVHDGKYAREHGLIGISSASEWKQVERDVKLADDTGAGYHVCHVSTKESVEIIRDAKSSGVDVTCETTPHYLTLTQDDLEDEGRFKMNPPVRESADRDALLEGISDGTVDIIATDHAPHSEEEKAKGLAESAFGIVGLETAFPVLYTNLIKGGAIPLERLLDLMAGAPRRRFGLPGAEVLSGGSFKRIVSENAGGGCEANVAYKDFENGVMRIERDYTIIDTDSVFAIDPDKFLSKGRATPFAGNKVSGRIIMTVSDGEVVYRSSNEDAK